MADIETASREYLLTKTTVTTIVGTRIYPERPEQGATLPYLVIREIDSLSYETLNGAAGIETTTLQVDAVASTRLAASALRETVRLVLQGYRGLMGTEELDIRAVSHQGNHGRFLLPTDKTDGGRYIRGADYSISYSQQVPSFD